MPDDVVRAGSDWGRAATKEPESAISSDEAAKGSSTRQSVSGKRKSLSEREKKKAAKAKIVVPPEKKASKKSPSAVWSGEFGGGQTNGEELWESKDGADFGFCDDEHFGSGPYAGFGPDSEADAESGFAEDSNQDRAERRRTATEESGGKRKRRSVKKRRLWPKVLLLSVLALVLATAGAFSWYRWVRGDDVVDMLGTWYVPNGANPILVEGGAIVLADDVAYSYALDTGSKTIDFTFGQMKGQGYYHFSPDRSILTIKDGQYSWMDTLIQDVSLTVEELTAAVTGKEVPVPSGDGVLVLVREPVVADGKAETGGDDAAADLAEGAVEGTEGNSEGDGSDDDGRQAGVAVE
ncbi:MAG: hypothetical protein IJC51_01175 [Eggerthellaceae bacterium]|nr:hypothetical protein [Eggerthellaceae bacterium]